MGCNAGLGRDGHAMVTRKAASQQAATQQAAVESELSQSVQAHVRGSLEHGQRMRNNSNSYSYSNSYSNSDSASARTIDWGSYATEHGCMRARCIAQPDWSAHPR
jgi:hypothetical protein